MTLGLDTTVETTACVRLPIVLISVVGDKCWLFEIMILGMLSAAEMTFI